MEEFDIVELVNDFQSGYEEVGTIPAGTRGVIVFIHEGERDFEVELFDKTTKNTVSVETINVAQLKLIHKNKQ